MKKQNFSGLCGIFSSFFVFSLVVIIWALLVVVITPSIAATYDGTLPADNSKIASAPAMIRENLEALRLNGIVNAQRLASYTPVEVMGELFSCVASTTSTAMLNSSGTNLLLGSATGTHRLLCLVGTSGYATASAVPFSATYYVGVWVATTTEIISLYKFAESTSAVFNMGIATSSTRGEIIFTASGTTGPTWDSRVWRNK